MDQMPTDQYELIIKLLRENQALLQQNNELLHKHERRERRRLVFKVIWYTILLGIPMLAYYYLYSSFMGLLGGRGGGVDVPTTVLENLLETYLGR